MTSRRFCFTINNPSDEDCEAVYALALQEHTEYLIVGTEKGEEGTPHLQCYIVFKKPWRFSKLKKLLPRSHIEAAKGTSEQNREYCGKEGNAEEFGVCPKSTQLTAAGNIEKWLNAIEKAKLGLFEHIAPDLRVRFKNTLESYYDDACIATNCIDVLDHLWIVGPTGCGKSRYVWDSFPGAYRKGLNKWWCHYKKESVVALEDVDPTHEKWLGHFLKIWSDHYPFIAERKGGSRQIRPDKIVITSNYAIKDVFKDPGIHLPLRRRFKEVSVKDGVLIPFDGAVLRMRCIGPNHYAEV